MLATRNKKKRTKRHSSKKRHTQKLNWQKFIDSLFQHIGKWTVIIVALLGIGLLIWRAFDTTSPQYTTTRHETVTDSTKRAFVNTIAPVAQRLQRQYGVLASVSMAQAMLESNFGASSLSAEYYNLFGVKTSITDADGVDLPTKEFVNDEWITVDARFKVYSSWEESLEEHAALIYYGTSWDPDFYRGVINGTTYYEQAQALQDAGYATDPDYAHKLIEMIETWNLTQYDQPIAS